jgi:hypothetical protein
VDNELFEFDFPAGGVFPRPSDPENAAVADRFTVDETVDPLRFTWTGAYNNAVQAQLLQDWTTNMAFGTEFRQHVEALILQLRDFEKTVPIAEVDWQPRPQAEDFYAIVGNRAYLGRTLVEASDLILVSELEYLRGIWKTGHGANAPAMKLLYDDALRSGFEGASLQIRAFRGGAEAKSDVMTPVA